MAAIFAIFSTAIAAILMKRRELAMIIIFIGLVCTLLMFYFHASDVLKINW